MDNKIGVELRLNNVIYKCQLEGKFYNVNIVKPFAVMSISGLVPQGNQIGMSMEPIIICGNCFKNKDSGLDFKEPSQIIPASSLPKDLLRK